MEKLNYQTVKEDSIEYLLIQIKNYAHDHSLTATQVRDIFHEGILSSSKAGKIQIPSYSDDDLPVLDISLIEEDI